MLRHVFLDVPQEGQELLMAMAGVALGHYLAAGSVERGEQGSSAVAHIVVRDALDIAQSHRQHWLGSLEGLALALLIDAQHQGVVRRVEIEADNVAKLLDEER